MPTSELDNGSTMLVDETLYKKIKVGIDNYFFSVETLNVKDLAMTQLGTYNKLVALIESENSNVELRPRFLKALYSGEKTNKNSNKEIIIAICKTLNITDDNENEYKSVILEFKKICEPDKLVKDLAGEYKLFLGGRQQPSIYDLVYENHLTIYESGITKKYNPFSKKTFWGYCLIRESKTLEILSLDIKDSKVAGIGSLMMFKINEYKKLSHFFPGINLSFDGFTMPVIYHALLSADFLVDKKNKIVKQYFENIGKNLRMECPDLSDTEKLRHLFDT